MRNIELNKMLISEFQNLQDLYLEETKWQDGDETGSHIVYGDIFAPYIRECILNHKINEINKISKFLENLLNLNDNYIDEVVTFSVIESIFDLIQSNDELILLFGCKSQKIIFELKEYYGNK